jgi:hypothetical protein
MLSRRHPVLLKPSLLSLVALLLLGLPLLAAPRDELLRLVPGDAGFCLVIQNLRTHADNIAHSPFAAQFRKSSIGIALADSPELKKIENVEQEIKKHLGVTADQLREDIYGDAIVFAYRPAPDGKPDGEEGVFLLRARDGDLLARLISRVNELQKTSGELKELTERKHEGVSYFLRAEPRGDHFYYLNGKVLAFTGNEAMLKRVIELDRRETREMPALIRDMQRLGVQDAMLIWWVNPRAFDAQLKRKVADAKPAEVHSLKRMQLYWQALDGAAFTLTPTKTALELSVAFLGRDGEMPEPARKFFAGDNKPSELWSRFPSDALLTIAGKIDVPALAEFLGDFMPPDDRKKIRDAAERFIAAPSGGLDLSKDFLPNLGPDWGICVVAPGEKDKAATPQVLAALRAKPGEQKKQVDHAVFDVLDRLAALAVIFSPDPVKVETELHNKVEIKFLRGDKGAAVGVEPAFALKDGYLLLGTSPAAIKKFGTGVAIADSTAECPLVRISFRALRGYLKTRMDDIVTTLATKKDASPEETRRRLEGMIAFCNLFEHLELTRRAGPGVVALTLRLKTDQALAK